MSSDLIVGTNIVRMDEPCFGLSEVHLQSPGSRGFRRYRILYVIRGDRLAEMRIDMGPESKFKGVGQFRVPGGVIDEATGRGEILHTVGELVDIADMFGRGAVPELPAPTNFAQAYHDAHDVHRRRRNGRRQFGRQSTRR